MVGRQNRPGKQRVSIGRGCGHQGVVAHEIGRNSLMINHTCRAMKDHSERKRPNNKNEVNVIHRYFRVKDIYCLSPSRWAKIKIVLFEMIPFLFSLCIVVFVKRL